MISAMLVVAFAAVWYWTGVAALRYHWRREFAEEAPVALAALVGVLGPVAVPAGYLIHSDGRRR